MSLDAQLIRVGEKLIAAQKHDRLCKRFGSRSHGYRLGPKLPITQLSEFESEVGLAIPEDFRRFVVEVGNGGAGPAYGWPAFDPQEIIFRQPAWQALFEIPKEGDDAEPSGYITLSNHGCGIFDFLVVNGEERGNVWFSDDSCELHPVPGREFDSLRDLPTDGTSARVWRQRLRNPGNTSRITFIDFFETWLDEVLADHRLAPP